MHHTGIKSTTLKRSSKLSHKQHLLYFPLGAGLKSTSCLRSKPTTTKLLNGLLTSVSFYLANHNLPELVPDFLWMAPKGKSKKALR